MFENPRRCRQARNFTTNVPKILDLNSSSEQIFSENCRWVPLLLCSFNIQSLYLSASSGSDKHNVNEAKSAYKDSAIPTLKKDFLPFCKLVGLITRRLDASRITLNDHCQNCSWQEEATLTEETGIRFLTSKFLSLAPCRVISIWYSLPRGEGSKKDWTTFK